MGGFVSPSVVDALRTQSTERARLQTILDTDPGVQAALATARARTGSALSSAGREQFIANAYALRDALNRAGAPPVPEGYTIDIGSGRLEKSDGFPWGWVALGVGIGVATWGIGFGFAGLGGAGAAGSAGGGAAVLEGGAIPLVSQVGHVAVPGAIASQGASAAVYATAATTAAGAAASAAIPSVAGASAAGTIAKQAIAAAPKIAGLFRGGADVPDSEVPTYGAFVAPRPLDSILSDPMLLAALAGAVVLALVLARK